MERCKAAKKKHAGAHVCCGETWAEKKSERKCVYVREREGRRVERERQQKRCLNAKESVCVYVDESES